MGCKKKHFATSDEAAKHIWKHHRRRPELIDCPCGSGWREMFDTDRSLVPDVPLLPRVPMHADCACFRKCRYPTEAVARAVIARRNFDGRAYACMVCGGWHITKQAQRGNPSGSTLVQKRGLRR